MPRSLRSPLAVALNLSLGDLSIGSKLVEVRCAGGNTDVSGNLLAPYATGQLILDTLEASHTRR